jgi:hypothetical protein
MTVATTTEQPIMAAAAAAATTATTPVFLALRDALLKQFGVHGAVEAFEALVNLEERPVFVSVVRHEILQKFFGGMSANNPAIGREGGAVQVGDPEHGAWFPSTLGASLLPKCDTILVSKVCFHMGQLVPPLLLVRTYLDAKRGMKQPLAKSGNLGAMPGKLTSDVMYFSHTVGWVVTPLPGVVSWLRGPYRLLRGPCRLSSTGVFDHTPY